MRKTILWAGAGILLAVLILLAQDPIRIILQQGERPAMAVTDFRAAGDAQRLMNTFNGTLFSDLETSGLFRMVPKSLYPLQVPQRPQDFRPPAVPDSRRGVPSQPASQGMWLTDWSGPPVNANWLAFGYAAAQNNQLAVFGWLFDLSQSDVANAQVFGKLYNASLDEDGARKTAHEFASDIIAKFGGKTLFGSRIYFVSNRTGHKEIWSMDPDGSNQKRLTFYNSISIMPAVSPDGTKIAFTSFARGNPAIFIHSLETGRRLPFYNQVASMNATPDFTPDGKHILYSSTVSGYAQIYIANLDGSGLQRLSNVRAVEVEPKVNPKTGAEIVFSSGRSGSEQIYKMNIDGADVQRLTDGEGEASNPAWHPDGQLIAFAWTRGYEPGHFNIFVMDVATRKFIQLTHDSGRNENPSWAPDGRHLVFASDRSGSMQIWTMLADGMQLQRLTTQGRNETPVWGK